MRRFVPIGLLLAAPALSAQSISDGSLNAAPQFQSYRFAAPSNETISEFAVPIYALIPLSQTLNLDLGSAFASVQSAYTTNGTKTTSSISGLTDTQLRLNYAIGTDFVVITAGVNLPTGRATATPTEQAAATLIASDFLALPITSLGTGVGGTGGVAMARPLGDWNLGLGVSMRHSAAYNPFQLQTGGDIRYQPGDEFRARAGLDHPFGTGRITVGETYSRFGNDMLDSSIYNTGDRWITELAISNAAPGGDFLISGWNLFRTNGTLADGSTSGRENVADLAFTYGTNMGNSRVEPTIEARAWTQAGVPASMFGSVGFRVTNQWGAFAVSPSIGYSIGNLAAQSASGSYVRANLTGFKAQLAIRLQ